MVNKEQPSCHVLDAKLFRRHGMMSFYGDRRNVERSPMEMVTAQFGTSLKEFPGLAEVESWPLGVNPTRSENWR